MCQKLKTDRSWSLSHQGSMEACAFFCQGWGHSWLGVGQALAARPCHCPPRRASGNHFSALRGVTDTACIPRAGMTWSLGHEQGGVMPWAQDRQGQKVVPSRAWKNHPGNTRYLNEMLKLGVVDTEPVFLGCYPVMCQLLKKPWMNFWMHFFLFCSSKILCRKE